MIIINKFISRLWGDVIHICSGESILKKSGSNGGSIILLRSLIIAVELTIAALLLQNLINPELTEPISWRAFRTQLINIAPWFAGSTGVVYAALYARFAAQWSYLASLYNQIKQAELEMAYNSPNNKKGLAILAEWKAGYIEDSHSLHLHAKENVAAIVYHWGKSPMVAKAFIKATPGGKQRWDFIQQRAESAYKSSN